MRKSGEYPLLYPLQILSHFLSTKKPGISPRLCPNLDSHFSVFNRMQLLIVCLQSGSGHVKQLGLYGQTFGGVLRRAFFGALRGLCAFAGGDMSGWSCARNSTSSLLIGLRLLPEKLTFPLDGHGRTDQRNHT